MRIVVDANIAFSAVLNKDRDISKILLRSKNIFNFYSTDLLFEEIYNHKKKLLEITGYSNTELDSIINILEKKINIVDIRLVPKKFIYSAISLIENIDINDVEYVALSDHIKGKLWTGDKKLILGLKNNGWIKLISTQELKSVVNRKK